MPNRFRSVLVVLLSVFIPTNASAQMMYWVDQGTSNEKTRRANLDGSNVEDLVTTGLIGPSGIAVDSTVGKVFWTEAFANKIQRANLDGTNVEDIVTGVTSHGIAIAAVAMNGVKNARYWPK